VSLKALEADTPLVERLGGRDATRARTDDANALRAWLSSHGPNYLRRDLEFAAQIAEDLEAAITVR